VCVRVSVCVRERERVCVCVCVCTCVALVVLPAKALYDDVYTCALGGGEKCEYMFVYVCVGAWVDVCVRVLVCERERERTGDRERVCGSVCARECVCASACT